MHPRHFAPRRSGGSGCEGGGGGAGGCFLPIPSPPLDKLDARWDGKTTLVSTLGLRKESWLAELGRVESRRGSCKEQQGRSRNESDVVVTIH